MEKLCLMKVFMEVVQNRISVDGGVGNLRIQFEDIYMPIEIKEYLAY